jgi:hypothetical protein
MCYYSIPEKLINVIKAIYDKGGGNILYKGKLSSLFEFVTGVQQGCLLSPFPFPLATNWIMKNCEDNNDIQRTLEIFLGDLDFADDIALATSNRNQMQRKTSKMVETSSKIGLQINIPKTKILRINATFQEPILIGQHNLEDLDSFEYLGSKIDETGGTEADLKARINNTLLCRDLFFKQNPGIKTTDLHQ